MSGSPAPHGPPSRDEFAAVLIERLKQAGDTREIHYDKDLFRLQFTNEGEFAAKYDLHRHYDELHRTPLEERKAWWVRIIRILLNPVEEPQPLEISRPELRPLVRPRSYFDSVDMEAEIDDLIVPSIPFAPVGDYLAICVARDLPETMAYVDDELLKEWGFPFRDAARAARQNLDTIEPKIITAEGKVFLFLSDDSYDAGRLLCRDIIRQFPIQGDVVAVVPNRNRLFITGTDDEFALQILAMLTEEYYTTKPDPMCPVPLRRVGNKWITWIPPEGHSTCEDFCRLQRRYLLDEYKQQKELLLRLGEARGDDTFIASYSVATSKQDEGEYSYAVWAKDERTLLPEAEYVSFFRIDIPDLYLFARWEEVVKVVGHLMTKDEKRHPARWYVDQFPSNAELKQMNVVNGPL